MAGVGGMGIGVVNAILVRAGHKEGYRVIFADKKGLAIRNGGVYSQITFVQGAARRRGTEHGARNATSVPVPASRISTPHSRSVCHPPLPIPTTGSIPYGKADLLIGIDILEAARAIDPREQFRVASSDRTCAVLNTHKQPTVYTLLGKQDFDPDVAARRNLRPLPGRAFASPATSRNCASSGWAPSSTPTS